MEGWKQFVEKFKAYVEVYSQRFKQLLNRQPEPKAYTPEDDGWQKVPKYIPASPEEVEVVSLIAAAIAAQDSPKSRWRVKQVWVENPMLEVTAVIASAIAAESQDKSSFVVKNIYQK